MVRCDHLIAEKQAEGFWSHSKKGQHSQSRYFCRLHPRCGESPLMHRPPNLIGSDRTQCLRGEACRDNSEAEIVDEPQQISETADPVYLEQTVC